MADHNQPIVTPDEEGRTPWQELWLARLETLRLYFRYYYNFAAANSAAIGIFLIIFILLGVAYYSSSSSGSVGGASSSAQKAPAAAANRAPTAVPSESSANQMKLKTFWAYQWARFEKCDTSVCRREVKTFFNCDYTSQTCRRGFHYINIDIWVTLAGDRKTELAHSWCSPITCLSFDTGEVIFLNARSRTISQDMPEDCVIPQVRDCEAWVTVYNGPEFNGYLLQPRRFAYYNGPTLPPDLQ